jgi:Dolichyl-phosphate-mannose-protein mannosyltransferase
MRPKSGDDAAAEYHPAIILSLLTLLMVALHAPLLRLPYFWDEAGYYIPAARDLLLTGSLIPHSTPSNAHPPLVMAYLALWWKVIGYAPIVTRTAMLVIAAFALTGLFRLAHSIANTEVAVAATLCTALYPVFFAQSALDHLDLAAAGFTFWGLHAYVRTRRVSSAVWFSVAGLAKETAILAPLALWFCEMFRWAWNVRHNRPKQHSLAGALSALWLVIPLLPIVLWYSYHFWRTGYVFGNPEFFRYNAEATVNFSRFVLALLIRLWQTFGYFHLFLLTLAAGLAMALPPQRDQQGERRRIGVYVQFAFLSVILAYVLAMSLVGGALLARYLLPVVPLVIVISVSTLWRRVRLWRAVITIVAVAFVAGWFINPPYGFSPEDNLAYRDYIRLHQHAETLLEARYPMARVLTAWPGSEELAHPYLGYVTRPMRVLRIEDFTAEQLLSAAELHHNFDIALVFSTKYEPPHPILEHWRPWQRWKQEFFGYHRDVPPAAAAPILGGQIIYEETRKGQWVAVIEVTKVFEARRRY